MYQNNTDWEATKEIYANSVINEGIIELTIPLTDMVGIRRLLPMKKKSDVFIRGDLGAKQKTPKIFALNGRGQLEEEEQGTQSNNNDRDGVEGLKKDDDKQRIDSTFEYCILNLNFQSPVIRLTFEYKQVRFDDEADGFDDEGLLNELHSVKIEIMYFPPEFELLQISPQVGSKMSRAPTSTNNEAAISAKEINPKDNANHDFNSAQSQWKQWLQTQCNELLLQDKISYSICEFVEHQALSYFHILHKDETSGYSALVFHDKERNEYEHYDPSSIVIWRESVIYATEYNIEYKKKCKQNQNQKKKSAKGDQSVKSSTMLQESCAVIDKHQDQPLHGYAIEAIQQKWKEFVQFECPICFDKISCHEGVELPCRHFLCMICAESYIQSTVSDLHLHRRSPFICPIVSCKQGMKIKSGSYPITKEEIQSIDDWKFNLKYPKATMLIQCPMKSCMSNDVRRASSDCTETMVFCNTCSKSFCELCLQQYKNKECRSDHELHICNESIVLKLCRRYKSAKDEIKLKADEKWHWLKDYADGREEDVSAKLWVSEHASRCPNCRTAIERIEGCFHMHCINCATHFCYECGEEIFYPYYGTHHCWEQTHIFND